MKPARLLFFSLVGGRISSRGGKLRPSLLRGRASWPGRLPGRSLPSRGRNGLSLPGALSLLKLDRGLKPSRAPSPPPSVRGVNGRGAKGRPSPGPLRDAPPGFENGRLPPGFRPNAGRSPDDGRPAPKDLPGAGRSPLDRGVNGRLGRSPRSAGAPGRLKPGRSLLRGGRAVLRSLNDGRSLPEREGPAPPDPKDRRGPDARSEPPSGRLRKVEEDPLPAAKRRGASDCAGGLAGDVRSEKERRGRSALASCAGSSSSLPLLSMRSRYALRPMKAGFASASAESADATSGTSGRVPSINRKVCASIDRVRNCRVAVRPRTTSRRREREATGDRKASISSAVPVTTDCR